MKTAFFLLVVLSLSAGEDSPASRAAASTAARQGDWRTAESHQRQALAACQACTVEERFVLRAELAGYLTLGGFPEAAIPLWSRSLVELPAVSPLRIVAELGLGVALHTAGRYPAAAKIWSRACASTPAGSVESAACRFNVAVSRMELADVWPELEELLPVLQAASGPVTRATALLQTARAALLAGKLSRTGDLLDQAEQVIVTELDTNHPFRAMIYEVRAHLSERKGDGKDGKSWRKKAEKIPRRGEWERATVSMGELKGKTR